MGICLTDTFALNENDDELQALFPDNSEHRTRQKALDIREAFDEGTGLPFPGPAEADETYISGKRKKMSNAKRKALRGTRCGAVDKTAVVGSKDRASNRVAAQTVAHTDAPHVAGFVAIQTKPGAKVYTDDTKVYNALDPRFDRESVNHRASGYVRGDATRTGWRLSGPS